MAREIFLTEGYGAASMSAIAAAVGGSKGTLYTYFKSKSELFGEVVRNTSEDPDWDSDFGPAAGAETTPDLAQVLTRIGERVLGMICRPHTVAL